MVKIPAEKHRNTISEKTKRLPVLGFWMTDFFRPMGEVVTKSMIVLPVQPIWAMTVSFVSRPVQSIIKRKAFLSVVNIPMGVPMQADIEG